MKWIIFFIIVFITIVCVCLVLGNRKQRDWARDDEEQMKAIEKKKK